MKRKLPTWHAYYSHKRAPGEIILIVDDTVALQIGLHDILLEGYAHGL